jgi:hypothetical protein
MEGPSHSTNKEGMNFLALRIIETENKKLQRKRERK